MILSCVSKGHTAFVYYSVPWYVRYLFLFALCHTFITLLLDVKKT